MAIDHPDRTRLRAYAFAVVVTAASIALTRLAWPVLGPTPFAPAFGAVAAVTRWGSAGAGLLSIALAAAGALLAFPTTGPWPWRPQSIVAFILVALLGNVLIAGGNRAAKALREREAQLRATLDSVRESEERLRHAQKMEAVGQLAAGVAHNFNNLLTIIIGYSDVLLDGATDASQRSAVAEIRKASDRGAALTRQLLAFGRGHDAKIARVDVSRTIDALRDMLTKVIREDIALTFDTSAEPSAVMIDPHDLEQVLVNLVLNARDALPSGGAIQVSVCRETFAAGDARLRDGAAPGAYVCLCVTDNGSGMSEDVRAHLFEPFFTTKEVGEGTGLGLAFVNGIARHAGGFVAVESAAGSGTTVFMYLAAAPPAPAAARHHEPAAADASAREATILLVEDEDGVRAMTSYILRRAGYRVLSAASPAEAIEIFSANASDIDLLLTDVVMPDMRGPVLAERLVAQRPQMPVLFVSGYSDVMPTAPVASRSAFLPKPFAAPDLLTTVAALLNTKRS